MKDDEHSTGQHPLAPLQERGARARARASQPPLMAGAGSRRRLLQCGAAAALVLPAWSVLAGRELKPASREPRPAAPRPLAQGQRLLVIDFVTALSQMMAAYVLAGMGIAAAPGASLAAPQIEQHRKHADQLARRLPRELRQQLAAPAQEALQARWRTVADACRTQPSLDIARLMLPMAREIAAPLLALLSVPDTRTPGGSEGRARRRLMLARLQAAGLSACWGRNLTDWETLAQERELLGAWVESLVRKGSGGVRLTAQWNLFASALPLKNTPCVAGAADMLVTTGERLNALL